MENFNGSLNGGQQEQAPIGKAIVFAIIGMLIGVIPYLIIGGVFDWRLWWVAGISVGGAVSIGWHVGKGPSGVARQVTVIILSMIGSILTIQLGYAISLYRLGYGVDFMAALERIFDWTTDGFGMMFEYFSSIFDNDNISAMLAWDTVLTIGVAIGVGWKKFNPNADDEGLEALDNDLEEINTDTPTASHTELEPHFEDKDTNSPIPANTGEDEVLNQDVPTLEID